MWKRAVVLVSSVACLVLVSAIAGTTGMAATSGVTSTPGVAGTTMTYEQVGKLSVTGTNLTDSHGNLFPLRGVSTHGLAWYPEYVNEAGFRTLRDTYGINAVRLAMYSAEYNGYATGDEANRRNLENLVERGVDACKNLGMYAVVDWHILSDGNPNTYGDYAVDFFGRISEKYKDSDQILYEICNEPNGGATWSDIRQYAERVIPVIRANDPDAIIIVGTPFWSQNVEDALANPIQNYGNLMYSLHFYAGTHKEDLRSRCVRAKNQGLPIMVTEFGLCDASGQGNNDLTEGAAWLEKLEQNHISYFAWNLSNKAETCALIQSSCSKTADWDETYFSEAGRWYMNKVKGYRN